MLTDKKRSGSFQRLSEKNRVLRIRKSLSGRSDREILV